MLCGNGDLKVFYFPYCHGNKKMRILFVANDFKPQSGGVAEYTHQLARHLASAGENVTVFAPIKPPGSEAHDENVSYEVERHDLLQHVQGWKRVFRATQLIGYIHRFRRIIRKHSPDVCVFNRVCTFYTVGARICKRMNVPVVLCTHGNELTLAQGRRRASLKRSLSLFNGINANSRYTQELVRELAPYARTEVVNPGVISYTGQPQLPELPAEFQRALEGPEPVFVSIFRHVKRKGLDISLPAFKKVLEQFPDAKYIIGGKGPETPHLKKICTELNLDDSVHFAGFLSEPEKHGLLSSATCYVMTSRQPISGDVEGFGIVYLEAALYGVPSIAGASGGAPEAVVDGVTGLVVQPDNVDDVAEAMIRIAENSEYRHQLGQDARRRAEKELSWSRQTEVMREFIHGINRA